MNFMMQPSRFVTTIASGIQVNACITIAIDTAYVAAQQGTNIGAGVYMMDNTISNGSSGEGQMELHTRVPVGSTIGFDSVPINPVSGDQVIITRFNVSQGSVFGSAGYPRQQPPLGTQPAGSWCVARQSELPSVLPHVSVLP